MKKLFILLLLQLTLCLTVTAQIPQLAKKGNQVQLLVDGEPFTMLAGELHNSTSGSKTRLDGVWKRMVDQYLNTEMKRYINSPLLPTGLLGPVKIIKQVKVK